MEHYTEHLITGIAVSRSDTTREKRHAGTKRKRATQDYHEIPWTASRCNRLLRTITSRISILQKLAASNRLQQTPDGKASRCSSTVPEKDPARSTGAAPSIVTPSRDPEWLPAAKGSTVDIRTYAGKTRKHGSARSSVRTAQTSDQAFGLPTPFVRRMMKTEASLSDSCGSESDRLPELPARSRPIGRPRSKQLPVKPNSLSEEAHTNLVSALESFLIATGSSIPAPRTGSTSLLSTCLRKVPDYIQLEQAVLNEESDQDDRNDNDAGDEIYAELESLGTGAGNGWAGLREVVRADGIQKICEAITKRLIPTRIVDRLVSVCSKCSAPREQQMLVETALLRSQTIGAAGLDYLYHHPGASESDGFCLRTTRLLLGNGKLTVDTIFAQQEVSRSVMRSMAQPGDVMEAAALVHSCFRAMRVDTTVDQLQCEKLAQKAQVFFERLAIVLTAVASTGRHSYGRDKVIQSVSDVVHCIATEIYLETASAQDTNHEAYSSPLLLGSLTLLANDCSPAKTVQQPSLQGLVNAIQQLRTAEASDKTKKRYQLIGDDFLSQIAMCLGRWTGEAGHAFLRETSLRLLELASSSDAQNADLMRALALNNAAAYADTVNDKASILIAEEIEALVLQDLPSIRARTPKTKQPKPEKYRWEDGLCEWILKTPLLAAPKVTEAVAGSNVNDDDLLGTSETSGDAHCKRPRIKVHGDGAGKPEKIPLPRRPGTKASLRVRTPAKHAIGESSDSEYDELAMSIKKAGRPQKLPATADSGPCQPRKQDRSQQPYHGKLNGTRNSSGSSSWDTEYFSDDELMGI